MKRIAICLLVASLVASCAPEKEFLFNGEDLDGWTIFVDDPTITPEDFFYVKDDVIETAGIPFGYIRTVKEYSDYRLHVEWRYPEDPVNSGIFLHTTGPDKLWPDYFQGQLKHGDAGDFIVQGKGMSATIRDSVYTATDSVNPLIPKLHPSSENSAGEWNSYDITCLGNTIELRVNGTLQNMATDCSLTSGSIGLQAEGSKIQFRNIWLEHLK